MKRQFPDCFPLPVSQDVELKPIRENEASYLFHVVDQNRSYLREFLTWVDHNILLEDSTQFIKDSQLNFEKANGLALGMYVYKRLIGVVSLYDIDQADSCSKIGYWMDQSYQGEGLMTQAVRILTHYAFQNLEIHRLEILCDINNYKSQKIAYKLGFIKEGLLRGRINLHGTFMDSYLYSLLSYESK